MTTRRLAVVLLLGVMLAGIVLPVEAQGGITDEVYIGPNLHNVFTADNIYGACHATWSDANPGWEAVAWGSLYGGCAGSGTIQKIDLIWSVPGPIYIYKINVWGNSVGSHYANVLAGGTSWGVPIIASPGLHEEIQVNAWIPSGPIIIEKTGLDYFPFMAVGYVVTSIQQIEIITSNMPPTPTPTVSPYPSWTPLASTTSYPTLPPPATYHPTSPAFTMVAPRLSPYPTIDTCPSNDIRTPCSEFQFPTLALPTFALPSPTLVALLPTNSPVPITFTPSPTLTTTTTPTLSPSPGASPTPSATVIIPTLDSTSWYDAGGGLTGVIPTLIPLLNAGFDLGGSQTPVGIVSAAEQLGTGAGRALMLVKSLELSDFNKLGGILSYAVLILVFSLLIEVAVLIIPFIEKLLHWLWRLIKLIPFIE